MKVRSLAVPLVVGVACFIVNFSVLNLLFSSFPWTISLFFGRGSWWLYQPFSIKIIYVVGVAPIIEELIHRRLVLQFFLNRNMIVIGLLVSGVTFGAHHVLFGWGILKAVDMFFVGTVFGLVYLKYRLLGSWIAHFSNNAASIAAALLLSGC